MRHTTIMSTTLGIIAAALLLAGCQAAPVGGIEPAAPDHGSIDEPIVDVDSEIPEECIDVAVGWYPGVSIDSLETVPAGWPAPPADAILCSTSSGGTIETASYATSLAFDELAAHYLADLPSEYTAAVISGDENGTGYDTVDGNGPGIAFQISERDGGFRLAFAREAG